MTRRIALMLVLALAAAACSVPTDGEPVAIAPEDLPAELLPSTTQAPVTTQPPRPVEVGVYLIDNSTDPARLVRDVRTISGRSISGALTDLVETPVDEDQPAINNWSIDDFTSLSTDQSDGTLVIDFTVDDQGDIESLASKLLRAPAAAQMVFTAAEFDDVDRVRFEINGEPRTVAISGSNAPAQESVERCDYRILIPGDNDFGTACAPLPTSTTATTTTVPVATTTTAAQIPE